MNNNEKKLIKIKSVSDIRNVEVYIQSVNTLLSHPSGPRPDTRHYYEPVSASLVLHSIDS